LPQDATHGKGKNNTESFIKTSRTVYNSGTGKSTGYGTRIWEAAKGFIGDGKRVHTEKTTKGAKKTNTSVSGGSQRERAGAKTRIHPRRGMSMGFRRKLTPNSSGARGPAKGGNETEG